MYRDYFYHKMSGKLITLFSYVPGKKMLEDLKDFNLKSKEELLKNDDCHVELKESMTKLSNQQPLILSKLEIIRPRLKELIRTRIEELVQFIFPINEIQSSRR